MKIELQWPDSIPPGQFSQEFLQGMLNRLAVGYYNYGPVRRGTYDWIASLILRLNRYQESHNSENLIDAANYAMLEFLYPLDPHSHFWATDKRGSPGAVTVDGRTVKGKDEL